MDTQRAFLAIALSLLILLGYQYFFAPPPPPPGEQPDQVATETTASQTTPDQGVDTQASHPLAADEIVTPPPYSGREGRDIEIDTPLYSAIISETGGGIKSFKLKNYRESLDDDSGSKELIKTNSPRDLPLFFSWGAEPAKAQMPVYEADREKITVTTGEETLVLRSQLPSGIALIRTLTFSPDDYLIDLSIDVINTSGEHQLQGAPFLSLANRPFSQNGINERFLFQGPALSVGGVLEEIKTDTLEDGEQIRSGKFDWIAYENTYFMTGIIPDQTSPSTVHFSLSADKQVTSLLTNNVVVLPPQNHKQYAYTLYFGPKKLKTLKQAGHNLDKIINFGWFDVLAKPMLYLLNFLYSFVRNYGVAIILVTVIIKALFWPIAHKGMKSMKTLQKLQPKMAKLREKYGNDKERLNREMIQLYQTYKVNPMGGCLPMLLQIPVFFALYKVLLQTIELRHAPFMLWINDLSAPDRLFIGVDIPLLGGIPVLTLLMGASMFLQQKMTPAPADPTQAKIMMFLPVIFTFMFLNFASGLVLYWFVNNLLSIAQQYVINKTD